MSSLDQMYQQVILDHAQRKVGSGPVDDVDGSSFQTNPTCGDEVSLGVRIGEDGTVREVVWDGDGCSISQASLSMMTELVSGKTPAEVASLAEAFSTLMHSRGHDVEESVLDVLEDASSLHGTSKFPNRVKCALLGWMALRDALAQAGVSLKEES
ncbi:MAG: SUF system NifU family Fe-S cluster assembly protein [Actinomycetaceae bacterium]|nr:SUF system NifU family Fe-S cluster assembly protein [Actinomycetaceae bacterium]